MHISNIKYTIELLSAKLKNQETVDSHKWQAQKMVAVLVEVAKFRGLCGVWAVDNEGTEMFMLDTTLL